MADFDASFALWSDPEITRHISGQPQTREAVWQRLLRYVGLWALLGYGYWAVFERDGGFIGEVGLADFHRNIDWTSAGHQGDAPECGWVISPSAQGRGYAGEAVAAALDWRDRSLPGNRTVCLVGPGNVASLRIAAKCGFRHFGDADYHGPVQLFERVTT